MNAATLAMYTRDGETRYQIIDAAARLLYRGTLPSSITGYSDGTNLVVYLEPTQYAPNPDEVEAMRRQIKVARRALESVSG